MKFIIRSFAIFIVLILALSTNMLPEPSAQEGISIIINSDNPTSSLTKEKIRRIYRGRTQIWENGIKINAYYLTNKLNAGSFFFENIMGSTYQGFQVYWFKKLYSGAAAPPTEVKSVENMMEKVADTPGAIGMVPASVTEVKGCKVIPIS